MKKEKNKEKDSKKKRYLSPSFRKGHISQEKIEEDSDDGDFKINLIEVEEEDDDDDLEEDFEVKKEEEQEIQFPDKLNANKTNSFSLVKLFLHILN